MEIQVSLTLTPDRSGRGGLPVVLQRGVEVRSFILPEGDHVRIWSEGGTVHIEQTVGGTT